MKKLIVSLSIVFLSGCAILDAYNMAKFDNNEYYLINQVRTSAELGKEQCGQPDAKKYVSKTWVKSNEFYNYSSSIPNNKETVTMSGALVEIVKGLNDKYKNDQEASKTFCEVKYDLILKNALTIQNVVGGKPR